MEPSLSRPQQIEVRRAQAAANYPALWARMTADWAAPDGEDAAWLMYSANYLFRTAGVRWAMDPLTLKHRLNAAPGVDAAADLAGLAFVVLTHAHRDHFDSSLIGQLKSLPITWVVPAAVWSYLRPLGVLPENRVLVPKTMTPIEIEGIRLTPFDGLHWEPVPGSANGKGSTIRGVPAVGYLAEFGGKRWLFPGDTRRYDASLLPRFGAVDGMFAHLWLGRGGALLDPPPLLDEFCRFCSDLNPGRVVVAHLDELGRDAANYWDIQHYMLAAKRFQELGYDLPISPARMGDRVNL